eukprot:scaffold70164_cov33-Tisochrysis_lutea.AAC.1
MVSAHVGLHVEIRLHKAGFKEADHRVNHIAAQKTRDGSCDIIRASLRLLGYEDGQRAPIKLLILSQSPRELHHPPALPPYLTLRERECRRQGWSADGSNCMHHLKKVAQCMIGEPALVVEPGPERDKWITNSDDESMEAQPRQRAVDERRTVRLRVRRRQVISELDRTSGDSAARHVVEMG